MKLKDLFESQTPNQFLKTRDEVLTWLTETGVRHFRINNKTLVVDVTDDLDLIGIRDLKFLPIKFGTVDGDFHIDSCPKLTTLIGCPDFVDGNFSCDRTGITSLEGAPNKVMGYFSCEECPNLTSLHDIHKYVSVIGSTIYTDKNITHLLGLLKIGRLNSIMFRTAKTADIKLLDIINNHIKFGGDIFKCQEDLIDAGFIEAAKL